MTGNLLKSCLAGENWIINFHTQTNQPATAIERSPPLKPTKVTLFTMILYYSENSIRDIRLFRRLLFCLSCVIKYTPCLLQ